jgi:outer membrane PBP1 activator LpoA protein
MKKSILVVALSGFAMIASVTSCSTSGEKVEAAKEDVKEAEDDLSDSKKDLKEANKEYQKDVEIYRMVIATKIVSNDEAISKYKEMIKTETKESKVKHQKQIDELEQKNKDLKNKMETYKSNNRENWEDFKKEFSHDMDELGAALKDLVTKNVK